MGARSWSLTFGSQDFPPQGTGELLQAGFSQVQAGEHGSKDSTTRCAEIWDSNGGTAEGRGCRGHGREATVTRFGTKQGDR